MAPVRKFFQRESRKFPATLWKIVAVATIGVFVILGIPFVSFKDENALLSFKDGVAFHFEALFWLAPFILLFIVAIVAVQRFTPLLTLPRHHDPDDEATSKDRTAS